MGLRRNFTWLLASKFTIMASGIITGGMINRSLGPSGRGVLAEMQTWVGLFMVIFSMSIDSATYHFANRDNYGDDDRSRFFTIFILNIVYALLAVISLSAFVFMCPDKVSHETMKFLFPLNVFLIFSMLAINLTVFFQALGNIKFSALIGIIQAGINMFVVAGGYFFKIIDLKFALISLIIVQLAALAMIFSSSFRSGFIKGRFSGQLAIGLILAGFKQHIATIATFVYTRINQLIVFKYSGEAQTGIFAVALSLAVCFMTIPGTFQAALYPRVIHSEDDYEITVRSMRIGVYIWGFFVILIMLSARPLLLIYGGNNFLPSVNVFRILMIGAWLLPLSSLIAPYYIKKGAFGLTSVLAGSLGIASIGINLFLVPRYASTGAALATTITYFVGFCLSLLFFSHLSGKNPALIFKMDFKKEFKLMRQAYLK